MKTEKKILKSSPPAREGRYRKPPPLNTCSARPGGHEDEAPELHRRRGLVRRLLHQTHAFRSPQGSPTPNTYDFRSGQQPSFFGHLMAMRPRGGDGTEGVAIHGCVFLCLRLRRSNIGETLNTHLPRHGPLKGGPGPRQAWDTLAALGGHS